MNLVSSSHRLRFFLLPIALALSTLVGTWIGGVTAESSVPPVQLSAVGHQMPDPTVELLVGQVQSDTIRLYDGNLSGEWPVLVSGIAYTIETRHTYSGGPIQMATTYVGEHLADRGLEVEYHRWDSGGVFSDTYPNVIGQLTGSLYPDEIYLIGAHLDSMPSSGPAPGADDNASGSTAVLIAADLLSQYQWPCTLRFAFFTGEEQGLKGSWAYAGRTAADSEHIRGMLNLDMIGFNTLGSEPVMEVHIQPSPPGNEALAQLYLDVVETYDLDLTPELIAFGTDRSDHYSFWYRGYPALLTIEDFFDSGDRNPNYHQSTDLLKHLDLDYFTEMVRAAVATMAHLASCESRAYLPVMFGGG